MKCLPPALTALTLSLLAAAPALALDQRQADALCTAWKLDCPEGDTATATGPGKGTGALECKVKGRPVKEGPSVRAGRQGTGLGDWKAGKKHGLQVAMRPNGSGRRSASRTASRRALGGVQHRRPAAEGHALPCGQKTAWSGPTR